MTEDQAKTKLCCGPLVVVLHHENESFKCEASACAAWRWTQLSGAKGSPYVNAIRDRIAATGDSLRAAKDAVDLTWTQPSPTDGYCGLAGPPS